MLTLTNINKKYADGTQALSDISITLPTGMVGLLGPNGAGKSSLMRTLACLQSVDTGQVNFDGLDVLQHPDEMRKQLGYLPQQFGVYPNMSCIALLEHIAILKGLDRKDRQQQISELLALLNLSQFANKKVSHFSGGMKQRFGIAQALLGSPKLIILDEPTAGLDPAERESLNNLLVTISKQRLVLLSTHIVEDIENQCHFVAMINQGRLIQSGEVAALIKPLHGCVWLLESLPSVLPQESFVLSQSYRYGKPSFRVYATTAPAERARPGEVTLQDSYFYELKLRGSNTCY
ncbi:MULTISPECIES: ABC transporter ATP-binding protein [Pseudoalteromonas]|uniref:ABC transporter ATP-binding protein n=1 Tax=Pseudoalteromonas rhizosphaerae TaxID=2518973 RepID=A0ABW8L352_9GAMM|nr:MULTISPECIES: ABC transporter ATP-binding protein [unclassified Pseudoalteromonas]MBB1300140.1 ABC transporter ATP-binding protein [Pseudoalteromonas sp. SR44-8]MBB1396117.1 ABC transporter ATP-binding protein [Pseudoalteromonas sp. SG44-8]|tara:strand:+ start:10009 stop:10881 length:873 start_codon:yes stop_codon:yes gene_type:complete